MLVVEAGNLRSEQSKHAPLAAMQFAQAEMREVEGGELSQSVSNPTRAPVLRRLFNVSG